MIQSAFGLALLIADLQDARLIVLIDRFHPSAAQPLDDHVFILVCIGKDKTRTEFLADDRSGIIASAVRDVLKFLVKVRILLIEVIRIESGNVGVFLLQEEQLRKSVKVAIEYALASRNIFFPLSIESSRPCHRTAIFVVRLVAANGRH